MAESKDLKEIALSKINMFCARIPDGAKKNTRYRSWKWCREYFVTHKDNPTDEIKDNMCLHLAFYLASWGMYRGSSFLLQNDYKIHEGVIDILLREEYKDLWNIDKTSLSKEEIANTLFDNKKENDERKEETTKNKGNDKFKEKSWSGLVGEIEGAYAFENKEPQQDDDWASDTLVTKILMGTMGCIPAFDRFLKSGIKALKKEFPKYTKLTQKLTKESFMALLDLRDDIGLVKLQEENENLKDYPTMKLLDMFLWEWGFENDIEEYVRKAKYYAENGKKEKSNDPKPTIQKLYEYKRCLKCLGDNHSNQQQKDILEMLNDEDLYKKLNQRLDQKNDASKTGKE